MILHHAIVVMCSHMGVQHIQYEDLLSNLRISPQHPEIRMLGGSFDPSSLQMAEKLINDDDHLDIVVFIGHECQYSRGRDELQKIAVQFANYHPEVEIFIAWMTDEYAVVFGHHPRYADWHTPS